MELPWLHTFRAQILGYSSVYLLFVIIVHFGGEKKKIVEGELIDQTNAGEETLTCVSILSK